MRRSAVLARLSIGLQSISIVITIKGLHKSGNDQQRRPLPKKENKRRLDGRTCCPQSAGFRHPHGWFHPGPNYRRQRAHKTHIVIRLSSRSVHTDPTRPHTPEGSAESNQNCKSTELGTNNKTKMTYLNRPIFLK